MKDYVGVCGVMEKVQLFGFRMRTSMSSKQDLCDSVDSGKFHNIQSCNEILLRA